jgi:hypothetical protein
MTTQILGRPRKIEADTRTLMQGAKLAISDVYDAITELVTNADDRYQVLRTSGRIEIEVERRRGDSRGTLRVRDFADGMTSDVMLKKLSRMGGRISGLEKGLAVRGTNSRGAKDVAAIGDVTFESIAGDGKYHKFEISAYFEYTPYEPMAVTEEVRERLGIGTGTGTVVTIDLEKEQRIPQHDTLRDRLSRLVPLRDILNHPNRVVMLIDRNRERTDQLTVPSLSGNERVSETIAVPGYNGITAKLTIKRAGRPFERDNPRFRLGGILVKSRHGIHEATLFDSSLENDVHAQWFYGKLVCEGIDDLWNEYDDRFERKELFRTSNPKPVIDPSRRTGLTRDHPFVDVLVREVLKRLRPLVEDERRNVESQRAAIENASTRKRLNELERAASAFLRDYSAEDDTSTDSERKDVSLRLKRSGFSLQPPFAQMIKGESIYFTFSVLQEIFPEFDAGSAVSIECLSPAILSDPTVCGMEPHPTREGLLRARFKVTGIEATGTTGVRVRLGQILAESAIEVLATKADRYTHINTFRFERNRYSGPCGTKRKRIRLVAPLSECRSPTVITLLAESAKLTVPSTVMMAPDSELQVAIADFAIRLPDTELATTVHASAQGRQAVTEVRAVPDAGAPLKIKIEDIDLRNQRYRMRNNVIEIAARHPSLRRYLGIAAEGFPGQNEPHFRVLVAEIVADAVCADIVSRSAEANPESYANADWDRYYAEYSEYMTKFLPIAHKIVVPECSV